ncbi:MAG: class I SAM-dependent methyltransferase, partial [Limisphaerales bacterium]
MAKKLIATLNDTGLFLQEWLANPQRMGSVVPSSRQLAAAMARWLPSDPGSFVLELGPGTGAVTEALIERGLREEKLVAIERNPKMARLLCEKFPRAQIITGDAWRLDELLREGNEPIESVGAVFSSLPLLNFPQEKAEALAQKIR